MLVVNNKVVVRLCKLRDNLLRVRIFSAVLQDCKASGCVCISVGAIVSEQSGPSNPKVKE